MFKSGGAIVFNNTEIKEIRQQRSRKTVMQILKATVEQNHALGLGRRILSVPDMLNRALERGWQAGLR
jgi:S-adenosylmethionine:tRNA-ribosyltransferase-isomerase (queuine synthetase)